MGSSGGGGIASFVPSVGLISNLGGSGSDAGLLGTGQYHTDGHNINGAAFDADPQEQELIKAMQDQAFGRTQNVALQQGLDQANAQASALAASQRGINPALAARLASQQQASNQQQANIQGTQLQQQQQGNLMNEYQSLRQSRQNREALASGNANAAQGVNAQAYEGSAGRRSGFIQGIGSAIAGGMADGGMVPEVGGATDDPFFDRYLQAASVVPQAPPAKSGGSGLGQMLSKLGGGAMATGGTVPGEATVEGDSKVNDTVPAVLSPGEIVIPRTVVEKSRKNPDAAAKFVAAILKGEKGAQAK